MERFLPFTPVLCLLLMVCVAAQFFLIAGLNARFARQSKMVRHFFSGPQGEDLEALLNRNFQQTEMALDNSQRALEHLQPDAERRDACFQHFALERYDAFEGVNGEQSFSLALLDGKGNGTVLTSLQNRQSARFFGKVIVDGQPQQSLSEEEQRVLIEALQSQNKTKVPVHTVLPGGKKPLPAQAQQQLASAA